MLGVAPARTVRQSVFHFFGTTTSALHHCAGFESVSQTGICLRIGFAKTPKKFAVASGDRAKSKFSRKYFYCQNSRLRVREMHFLIAVTTCLNSRSLQCELCDDERNNCSTGISLNHDKVSRKRFVRAMRCRANTF